MNTFAVCAVVWPIAVLFVCSLCKAGGDADRDNERALARHVEEEHATGLPARLWD
jgi:hypothetical protein